MASGLLDIDLLWCEVLDAISPAASAASAPWVRRGCPAPSQAVLHRGAVHGQVETAFGAAFARARRAHRVLRRRTSGRAPGRHGVTARAGDGLVAGELVEGDLGQVELRVSVRVERAGEVHVFVPARSGAHAGLDSAVEGEGRVTHRPVGAAVEVTP